MKTPAVFLIFLGVVFAQGDTAPNKNNQLEAKNTAKPNGLETASTRNVDLQTTHMQYQGNRMENAHNQDQKFTQHAQLQNAQSHIQHQSAPYLSQNQGSQVLNQDVAQRFGNQNQVQQFLNQGQVQQFRSQGPNTAGSAIHSDQEISNLLQSQQRMTPSAISMLQAQAKEQIQDFSAQQVYSGSIRPDQELYQDRRNIMDVQDQLNERRISDSNNLQNQGLRGVQSSDIRAGGYPQVSQVYLQRSAFDNREQPLVLPGVTQTHSASVVVSGLKNLPVLPGLVYSAAPVPATHAVAYSRPWFQGGAYVKQHWQTPYARYVYSHIL